jgi:hypothetical protein
MLIIATTTNKSEIGNESKNSLTFINVEDIPEPEPKPESKYIGIPYHMYMPKEPIPDSIAMTVYIEGVLIREYFNNLREIYQAISKRTIEPNGTPGLSIHDIESYGVKIKSFLDIAGKIGQFKMVVTNRRGVDFNVVVSLIPFGTYC